MKPAFMTAPLHAFAHGRSGDKGNRLNVSVIAYRPRPGRLILAEVTERRIADLFRHRHASRMVRYELPNLYALNFVVDDVLEGDVVESSAGHPRQDPRLPGAADADSRAVRPVRAT